MSAAIEALEQQLKEARQALRVSELRFRNIIERNADGILVVDRDGVVRFVNRAGELLLGRGADELVGSFFGFPMVAGQMTEIDLLRRNSETVVAEMHVTESEWEGRPVYLATLRDVNARKQAEAEVRFQAQLLDAVEQAVIATNLTGRIIYWNRSAETLFGWPAAEVVGRNILEVVPAPNATEQAADLMNYLRAGISWSGEFLVQRRDGSTFPAMVSDSLIYRDGNLVGIIGVYSDMTKQKQAEESLRASEARMRSIFRAAPIGIGVVSNRVLVDVNDRLCEITGYSQDELIGKNARVLYPTAEDYEYVGREKYRQIAAEGTGTVETHFKRKDGQLIDVLLSSTPLDPANLLTGVTFTALDITARKRAEQARERLTAHGREQARQMEQILASVPEGVLLLDADGRILRANPTAEQELVELSGTKVGDILTRLGDRPLAELLTLPPNKGLWHEVKVGKRIFEVIAQPVGPVLSLPHGHDTEPAHWVLVFNDLTQEREIQARFQQQERLAAVGQLAAGVAHDFNNLLTPIIGYAQLGMIRVSPDDNLYQELVQIDKAAKRAADLIRQILAFSRRQILELRILNFNEVIRDFEKMARRLLRENIEMQLSLDPACGQIRADRAQIEQILMNLVINARDAMPAGGILTIETAVRFLDETYFEKYAEDKKPGHYVMLTVSDTGFGMDAETQKHIFEPFFTTKERGQGTGLGLATVFGIVKQHQGYIWVYSEPGQGTTFKVYLPQAENAAQPGEITEVGAGSLYGTETILVVEDEEMVRKLVYKTLETYGYNVLEANSVMHALKLATEHKENIHLLLTDVIMPHMNGQELCQRIVALHPHIKSLFMSGYTDNVIAHQRILDRDINFIEKPFTVHRLVQKVREVLDQ